MCAARLDPTLESLESRVLFANVGDLDSLFSGGKVIADLLGGSDYGFAVTVQNDGKVLVAGQAQNGASGSDFAVLRLNADGSRDTTFGANGLVITDLGSTSDVAYALVVQSDGKIVVAGQTTRTATSSDFALVRYSANGALDTAFGTAGKIVTDFGGKSDQATGVVLTDDGHIVVAGWASMSGLPRFAVARYTTSGQLDSTFGTAGKTTTAYAPGYARGQSVVLLADGSMIVAGTAYNLSVSGGDFAAVKYLGNGQVDTTFGSSGWSVVDFGADEVAHALLHQSDGKLVLAGEYYNFDTDQADFALARLTASGSLDVSFGTGGRVLTDFSGDYDQGTSAVLQPNGKIVVAGTVTIAGKQQFGVVRYSSDGSLDTSFAGTGMTKVAFGASDTPNSIALDGQGRIVVGGFTMNSAGRFDFAVARFIGKINVAPTANPGSGYAVIAGNSIQLDGSASFDSDGVIVSYEWDLNYNGTTFDADATGAITTFSAAGLTGPATRVVALRVTDENGATRIATTSVSILKLIVPPVAQPGGSYQLTAGSSIQLDGSGSFDPDGVFLNYQWDFNYDGSTFDVDGTGATPVFSAAGLTGPMVRTVALRVTDSDGATSIATTTVSIAKLIVAPTAIAGGGYTLIAGASLQLDGSTSFDTDGVIVNYEWDFDYDGQTFDTDAGGAAVLFSAAGLTGPATRTVALRVTDDDGATSISTTTVTIQPKPVDPPPLNKTLDVQTDPSDPGHCTLVVHGTDGNDRMRFHRTRGGRIEVVLNGTLLGTFANVCRIVAYGIEGDDVIDARSAKVAVEFYGGSGNDRLYGGRFADILVGDDGDDRLWACGGNDLLIGGMGKDRLQGSKGHDLLVAGGLADQDSASSMESLLKNWNMAGITKLQRESLSKSLLVIDDATPDHLHGNSGKDIQVTESDDKPGHNKHRR